MITVLIGDNSFEINRALQQIVADFDGRAEMIDGSELELKRLSDLVMGGTLFADKRLVVIKQLSDNKSLWTNLSDWLPRVSDDIHLVLVESKPDKRTKTYKDLQRVATVRQFDLWGDRDTGRAEQWLAAEAETLGLSLDKNSLQLLVRRVGVDQWQLAGALQKLSVLESITPEIIEDIIEANPTENVFYLFETALRGDSARLRQMIATLEVNEDPYRLFGLLSGQVFQLAALSVAEKPSAEVAKDLGVHPYGLSQLTRFADQLDRRQVKQVVTAFATADADMKTSSADPWTLLEVALQRVAQLR